MGCDGRNGFHIGGWINGVMSECSAHSNGYYNYNFSGNGPSSVCDAPTHHILVDACTSYDAPSAHFSFSHCNHDITIRNSFAWGHGTAFNQYACAYRLNLYNNTFWAHQAVQLFANCRECDFRNNILRCDTEGPCVYIDFAEPQRADDVEQQCRRQLRIGTRARSVRQQRRVRRYSALGRKLRLSGNEPRRLSQQRSAESRMPVAVEGATHPVRSATPN